MINLTFGFTFIHFDVFEEILEFLLRYQNPPYYLEFTNYDCLDKIITFILVYFYSVVEFIKFILKFVVLLI